MSDQLPPHDNPADNPFAPGPIGSPPTPLTPPVPPTEPGPLEQHMPGDQDPGTSRALKWAWIAVALLLPIVVGLNQMQANLAPPSIDQTEEIVPPSSTDSFALTAKVVLKLTHFLGGAGMSEDMVGMMQKALTDAARSDADQVRLAIAQWELDQPDEAQTTLDNLAESLEPDAAILPDIQIVSDLLAGQPPATDDERDDFIARHGWFAEIALSHDDQSRHDDLLKGGGTMIAFFTIIFLGAVGFLIAGLVLLVIGLVRMTSGDMPKRFVPPSPGGSVYLEMLPVFIASFLMLQILSGIVVVALGKENIETATVISLALQWLLLGVIAWPLVRGVPWSRVRQDLGLFAPNGVLKEMRAGVLFYIASLPVYAFVIGIVVVLFWILDKIKTSVQTSGPPPAPPSNPIADLISGASPLALIMFVLLATVWAPLMEELIFRGGVFRHLRSKIHWAPAALIVAIFFGMMHNYHPLQLIPVMALGFIFAVMREWRGSIIASMTAHFIHNFVMLSITIVLFRFVLN